jgi:cytochrome P450
MWCPIPDIVYRVFEAGFLMFATFPMASIFFPKLLRARETVATAMTEYVRKGGPESASGLVRLRYEHHHERFGMSLEDIARGELGNTFAVLGNTAPCAFWLIYHIFSDDQVLADIRREVSALVYEDLSDDHEIVHSIDLAAIRDSSPILVSTLQETMRFRSVATSLRVVLEDVYLDNRYLLKKGSMLMIPGAVQHRDISAWGDNAFEFDHKRFIRKPGEGQKMPSRIAFRAFGGGHDLCPGRHFASTEILVFAALLVLQYDLVPLQGKWTEPKCDNTPAQSAFPIPDGGLAELEVEFRPRDASSKWNIKFSGSDKAIDMASEDSLAGDI